MDAYNNFMQYFNVERNKLFDWGIKNTIFPSVEAVDDIWKELLFRIYNNQKVYIRGYGRNGHATKIYSDFYAFLLGNEHIKPDPTNNSKPKSNIEKLTKLKRNKNIFNYQISHIWGHTKNIFLFEAPWNICYVPKIMDPFTGHEAKGEYIEEYQNIFKEAAYTKYKKYVEEYNAIIKSLSINDKIIQYSKTLSNTLDEKQINQFVDDCRKEFKLICL